jgi:hypothetical protein
LQQAEALALLAETALHALDPGAPGGRYQVVEDGARVSAETSRRLAGDASRVVMRQNEGERTVEVGARTRTIREVFQRVLAASWTTPRCGRRGAARRMSSVGAAHAGPPRSISLR